MDLKTYTDALPHGGITAFAETLGISSVYLHQLASRQIANDRPREPSPELAVLIERCSNRVVRRWDTRPNDWHLIWPELIRASGAPSVPSKAAQ